jgi:hypothetical protein
MILAYHQHTSVLLAVAIGCNWSHLGRYGAPSCIAGEHGQEHRRQQAKPGVPQICYIKLDMYSSTITSMYRSLVMCCLFKVYAWTILCRWVLVVQVVA